MPDRDEPNPLEAFLRQFGIQPGPDGNYDFAQLMGPLQHVMQQMSRQMGSVPADGPLNWTFIKDIARKVTAAEGPDPSPSSSDIATVRDTVGLAELWLDPHTAFGRTAAPVHAWSRAEWVEATMGTWEKLVGGLSASLAEAVSGALSHPGEDAAELAGMATFMEPMMRQAATGMLSAQIGQGIGQLSAQVLSGADLGFPVTASPVVALLPANIQRFCAGLDSPVADVRLFLALREAARQRLFAQVAWLGPQMLALIGKYARGITIDPTSFEEAIQNQLSTGMSADALQDLGQTVAGKLFQPTMTSEQTEILARLETLVAVVEGWVDDVVAQASAGLLPHSDALLELVRRRRASAGPAEAALKTLLNLELRPRRMRDAANVWAALRSTRGIEERDAVWAHPDLMPTSADLDDPLGFAERGTAAASDGVDDLDAALRQLLDEERPDSQS